MKKYVLLVMTNAVKDKEEEFNDWYSGRHLTDVIKIPGFKAAQRFRMVSEPMQSEPLYKYFASYEIETDDPKATMEEMLRRAGSESMPVSDGVDPKLYCVLYEPMTDRVAND